MKFQPSIFEPSSTSGDLDGSFGAEALDFNLPLAPSEESVEEDQSQRSFPSLQILLILASTILASQCFRLQVTQGALNQHLAEGNSIHLVPLQADRGLIEDSSGQVLAQNSRQLALSVDPQNLPIKKADRQAIYQLLQRKAGVSDASITLIEASHATASAPIPVKTNLSKDDSLLFKEWFAATPGVSVAESPIRQYANLPSLGQILGYVGPVDANDEQKGYTADQQVGKGGLEAVYNDQLLGTPGHQRVTVDASGQAVQSIPAVDINAAKPGVTLKLSLDSNLQNIVATALQHELARRELKFGKQPDLGASAVVLDPNTGTVKAMVSLPDYSAQLFSQGISQKDYQALLSNPAHPLLNRTIQGEYPSGSVIKPMLAAAGLQTGTITPNTTLVTPDAIYVGNFRFPDWKVHGLTDVRQAIAQSNDIFFYALVGGWPEKNFKGMGIDTANQYLSKFSLGSSTNIDLPGEQFGLLASPDWKQKYIKEPWYIGDTYHSAIGQGYTLVTPLQMAVATAAVANGGTTYQPSMVWSTIDPVSGQETVLPHPALAQGFVSAQNIQVVREGMHDTVLSGSGHPLHGLKVDSAGKTGTAEYGTKGLTHAWYTGFAPYDKPQIAFAIMIEGGGESFYSSVPVAEEILRGYFNEPLQPGQSLLTSTNDPTIAAFQGEH